MLAGLCTSARLTGSASVGIVAMLAPVFTLVCGLGMGEGRRGHVGFGSDSEGGEGVVPVWSVGICDVFGWVWGG